MRLPLGVRLVIERHGQAGAVAHRILAADHPVDVVVFGQPLMSALPDA